MSRIEEIYTGLEQLLIKDAGILSSLHRTLGNIEMSIQSVAFDSDEGYAFKFPRKVIEVKGLFSLLELNETDVELAFRTDWGYPEGTRMYGDPYYHILLLIVAYGLRENDQILTQRALLIILMALWNSCLNRYIKYCDKKIMKYVIEHMLTGKHLASEHSIPYLLLKNHFVPTLLETYGPRIIKDAPKLKELLMQSWNRLNQFFANKMKIGMDTGKKEAQGGLMALYMKAKKKGLSSREVFVDSGQMNENEDESFVSEDIYKTVSKSEDIVTAMARFIVNRDLPHEDSVITQIESDSGINADLIKQILGLLHHQDNLDIIGEMMTMILKMTRIKSLDAILAENALDNVRTRVIDASDPKDRGKINKLIDALVVNLKAQNPKAYFRAYEKLYKIPKRQLFIYGLWSDMREYALSQTTRGG
jgi:hypothetical protein